MSEHFEIKLPTGRLAKFRRPKHGDWDHLAVALLIEKWGQNNVALEEASEAGQITLLAKKMSASWQAICNETIKALTSTRIDMSLDVAAEFATLSPIIRSTRLIEIAIAYSQWVCPIELLGNSETSCAPTSPGPQDVLAASML